MHIFRKKVINLKKIRNFEKFQNFFPWIYEWLKNRVDVFFCSSLYMNGGLSKMRSLHTQVMHRMFYFGRYCMCCSVLEVFAAVWICDVTCASKFGAS